MQSFQTRSHSHEKRLFTFVTFVRLSARLSARTSATPTVRISVKFDTGKFYENLSRKSKSGYNWAKISGTLHEDLTAFIVAGDIKSP
jgi:hypothetical protein